MPLSVAAAKKPPNNWAIAHLPLFSIVQTHDHHHRHHDHDHHYDEDDDDDDEEEE